MRVRLTLQYAFLFLLTGALLLIVNYALARRSIDIAPETLQQRIEARLGADLPDTPRQPPDPTVGQVFVLFIMALAAAEVAITLSIIIAVYRNYRSIDSRDLAELKG